MKLNQLPHGMGWGLPVLLLVTLVIVSSLVIPTSAQAEVFVAVMGGYSFLNEFTNVVSSGRFPGTEIPDADLGNAGMVGGKVGFYMPDLPWFGFEAEGFFTNPTYKPFEAEGVDANLEVVTLGFNALIRYPGERVQPYLGGGVGIFFATIDTDLPGPSLDSNTLPGFNLLGGVRGLVTESIVLFLEYKYNQVDLKFRTTSFNLPFGFEGTYRANIIAAGIGYRF